MAKGIVLQAYTLELISFSSEIHTQLYLANWYWYTYSTLSREPVLMAYRNLVGQDNDLDTSPNLSKTSEMLWVTSFIFMAYKS